MPIGGLEDYAQALGLGQRLVPGWRDGDFAEAQLAGQRQALAHNALVDQQAAQDRQYQVQRRDAFNTGLQQLGAKPSAQAYRQLGAQFPEFLEALEGAAKGVATEQAQSMVRRLAPVQSLIAGKNYDAAAAEVKRHIDADKNAGIAPDEDDQHLYDELTSGDPARQQAAGGIVSGLLYSLDPENAAKNVAAGNETHVINPGGALVDGTGRELYRAAPAETNALEVPIYDTNGNRVGTQLVANGGKGGDPSSVGGVAGRGSDTSRLINSDAGGGQVPPAVQTLGQFVGWGRSLNQRGAKSSSAGTYQINGSTMAQFAPLALGEGWQSQPFNAVSQDKVGEAIFNWAKGQPNPAKALAGRWVSLSPQTAAKLVRGTWQQARGAIAQGETGGGTGSSASASNSPAAGDRIIGPVAAAQTGATSMLDPETMASMAQQYLAGDASVMSGLGSGKVGAANRAALRNAITVQAKAMGLNGGQIAGVMQDFKMHQQGLNAFARGPEARTVRSLNVTIDHLDTLQTVAQALQNGNYPVFNKIRQTYARATGSAVPTNFEGVRQIVSAEVAKAITGGNTALADRQDLAHSISTANSPQQLAGYIAEVKKLMAGQLQGLAGQYQSATGRSDFGDRLSPRTRRALGYDQPVQTPRQTAGGFSHLSASGKYGWNGKAWVAVR